MYGMEVGRTKYTIFMHLGVHTMATTGELRAIIEELELVDIGDAANYLGEEADTDEKILSSEPTSCVYVDRMGNLVMDHCSATQRLA